MPTDPSLSAAWCGHQECPEGRCRWAGESAATPREVLIEARLVSHTFVADDGYLSSAIHTSEEAADLALAALAKAGWKVVRDD